MIVSKLSLKACVEYEAQLRRDRVLIQRAVGGAEARAAAAENEKLALGRALSAIDGQLEETAARRADLEMTELFIRSLEQVFNLPPGSLA